VSNPAVKTKFEPEREKFDNHGAGGENRTPNLLITKISTIKGYVFEKQEKSLFFSPVFLLTQPH